MRYLVFKWLGSVSDPPAKVTYYNDEWEIADLYQGFVATAANSPEEAVRELRDKGTVERPFFEVGDWAIVIGPTDSVDYDSKKLEMVYVKIEHINLYEPCQKDEQVFLDEARAKMKRKVTTT